MPDDPSDKIIKLLEEIRDLTRERNGKYDEALKRQEEARERALRQRRLFRWMAIPLLLLAIGFMIYIAFWVIPGSDEREYQEQLQQYQMIQTNLQAQPH